MCVFFCPPRGLFSRVSVAPTLGWTFGDFNSNGFLGCRYFDWRYSSSKRKKKKNWFRFLAAAYTVKLYPLVTVWRWRPFLLEWARVTCLLSKGYLIPVGLHQRKYFRIILESSSNMIYFGIKKRLIVLNQWGASSLTKSLVCWANTALPYRF